MADYASARRKMVDCQLRTNDVTDHAVLKAMGDVPREAFVPSSRTALAYIDEDLPVEGSDGRRFLMRPATFAKLLQLAEIGRDDVVLLVGGASGYEAAVLARLAGSVVALECDADLAKSAGDRLARLQVDNAALVVGPLERGWPAEAPYDVIVVVGAIQTDSPVLAEQLRDGGRMVAVLGLGGAAEARLTVRSGGDVGSRFAFNAAAKPLPGFEPAATFVF
jgi:protein-L-isoaspartate(D-aspartate) O-methyltransferase